jgi:guanine deaminase
MSEHMDNPFMARAIQLSIDNVHSGRGGPFGAVVVKDGAIIAEGANQVTSTNDPTAHAEVSPFATPARNLAASILKAARSTLPASRAPCVWEQSTGPASLASISPTPMPMPPKIGFDDSLIYREIAQPHSQRKIPMIQMMREEALAAFRAWENKPNKIEY